LGKYTYSNIAVNRINIIKFCKSGLVQPRCPELH
jgi:hypothetical protein